MFLKKLTFISLVLIIITSFVVPKSENSYNEFKQEILALHMENKDKAIQQTRSWIQFSQKKQDWSKLADAFNMLGVIYGSYREFDSSQVNYSNALKIATKQDLQLVKNKVHMNIGMNYFYQANYAKALTHFHEALSYFEREKDEMGMANALSNIGFCHTERGEAKKALNYLNQAESLFEKARAYPFCARTLNGIGTNYVALNKQQKAIENFEEALNYYGSEKSPLRNAVLVNLGMAYLKVNKLLKAKEIALQAFNESRELTDLINQSAAAIIVGKAFAKLGQNREAIQYFEKAIPLAIALKKLLDENTIYYDLAHLYEKINEPVKAFTYLKKHLETNELLLNEAKEKSILALESKYEAKQQKKELALKKVEVELLESKIQKKRFTIVSILLASTLLIVGLLYLLHLVKNRNSKREKEINAKLLASYKQLELLRHELEMKNLLVKTELVPSAEKQKINTCLMDPLSDRELEILDLLSVGKTNKEIANSTFISENTVKFHLKNIYVKLDASNRKEAVNKLVNFSTTGLN